MQERATPWSETTKEKDYCPTLLAGFFSLKKKSKWNRAKTKAKLFLTRPRFMLITKSALTSFSVSQRSSIKTRWLVKFRSKTSTLRFPALRFTTMSFKTFFTATAKSLNNENLRWKKSTKNWSLKICRKKLFKISRILVRFFISVCKTEQFCRPSLIRTPQGPIVFSRPILSLLLSLTRKVSIL